MGKRSEFGSEAPRGRTSHDINRVIGANSLGLAILSRSLGWFSSACSHPSYHPSAVQPEPTKPSRRSASDASRAARPARAGTPKSLARDPQARHALPHKLLLLRDLATRFAHRAAPFKRSIRGPRQRAEEVNSDAGRAAESPASSCPGIPPIHLEKGWSRPGRQRPVFGAPGGSWRLLGKGRGPRGSCPRRPVHPWRHPRAAPTCPQVAHRPPTAAPQRARKRAPTGSSGARLVSDAGQVSGCAFRLAISQSRASRRPAPGRRAQDQLAALTPGLVIRPLFRQRVQILTRRTSPSIRAWTF